MEDKQLIYQLQNFKDIKPRREWAFLVKNQILGNNVLENMVVKKDIYGEFLSAVSGWLSNRKLSYALAVFLFVFVGVVGMKYFSPQPAGISPGVLNVSPASVKSSVEAFKIKSQNLAEAVKNKSANIPSAVKEVQEASKALADSIQKDPTLAKKVALAIKGDKALLDLTNSNEQDIKETSDVLYKAIDSQIIADLEKSTLTENQQAALKEVKELYNIGKYSEVLEKILLINN